MKEERMDLPPLQARRRRATRGFLLRVGMLLTLIGLVAYASWFAPWAKPVKHIPVETVR